MTTQPHNFRLTPNDWALVQEFASEHKLTPQQWVVNMVLRQYAEERGREWEGVRETAGNPNWMSNRCQCGDAWVRPEKGVNCARCGKSLFGEREE